MTDGRNTAISASSTGGYNDENGVFYFHPETDTIIDSGTGSTDPLQSGLAVFAGFIASETPNLTSANIKNNVTILGVTGSLVDVQITQDQETGIVTII